MLDPGNDNDQRQGYRLGQVEPVRDKLRCLADRGWLHRTPANRFTALLQPSVGPAAA